MQSKHVGTQQKYAVNKSLDLEGVCIWPLGMIARLIFGKRSLKETSANI